MFLRLEGKPRRRAGLVGVLRAGEVEFLEKEHVGKGEFGEMVWATLEATAPKTVMGVDDGS